MQGHYMTIESIESIGTREAVHVKAEVYVKFFSPEESKEIEREAARGLLGLIHYPGRAPEVGMGCTYSYTNDSYAATVVAVNAKKTKVTVQGDRAIRTDSNGLSEAQSYRYSPDVNGSLKTFTLRKDGGWWPEGDPIGSHPRLSLGKRDSYRSPSL